MAMAFPETIWFDETALPRCFVLNEKHHVILACSPRPNDPLNARFMPLAHANHLPSLFDNVVLMLEEDCAREDIDSKSALVPGVNGSAIRVSVAPLHGPWGNHTTVTIDRAE